MSSSDGALRREFATFGRYLVGRDPGTYPFAAYERWHVTQGHAETAAAPQFDRALVGFARRGTVATRIADAYCARFRRAALLRRKLVLVLALVECSPETFALVEEPRVAGRWLAWGRIAASGAVEAFAVLAGVLLLGPVHAALSLGGSGRTT